ncbi:MAG: lipid A-modifier LpxR family protein [Chitinophagaceae bacterium]
MPRLTLLIILCCTYLTLPAQEKKDVKKDKSGKFSRYGLTLDQDMFIDWLGLKNEDRNYTMGLGLFWTNDGMAKKKFFAPFRAIAAAGGKCSDRSFKMDLYKKEKVQSVTLSLGVTGFTPLYLGVKPDSLYYIQHDRPFSSITFFSIKFQTATPKKVETNQLVFGLLGLHIGGEVQSYIHREHWFHSTRDIPYGWKYQLYDGGTPAFLLSNRADFLLNDESSYARAENKPRGLNAQIMASREYRVGYYTGGSVGIALRAGWLDPNNWSSYDSYQLGYVSTKKMKEDNAPAEPRLLRGEFYLQGSLRGTLMLYNQHLQKKGRLPDNLEYNYNKQYVFLEGFAGAGGTIPFCKKSFTMNLLAYVSGRTAEIKSPVSNRTHLWGGLQLSFTRVKP